MDNGLSTEKANPAEGPILKQTSNHGDGNERVIILRPGNHLTSLMTILRDSQTGVKPFTDALERVADQLIGRALDLLPAEEKVVFSPAGASYCGIKQTSQVCGVSILRAGASMENALRRAYTGPLSFGKILIQRNEETCLPTLLYSKFPSNVSTTTIFLLEPMLATGGSACMAINLLLERGIPEENIVFINLIASRHGVQKITSTFPALRLVTAAVDADLTPSNHISPGLGDFGDRFYGTVE